MTADPALLDRAGSPAQHKIPRAAAILVCVIGLASVLINALVTLLSDQVSGNDTGWPWQVIGVVGLAVGAVIALQRPAHAVGWILLGLAIAPVSGAMLAVHLLVAGPTPSWWITIAEAMATASFAAPIPLVLLVFPTGDLLSPRWRPAVILTALATAVGTAASLILGGWAGTEDDMVARSPLRPRLDGLGTVLSNAFFPLFLASLAGAVASVVIRYRRSRGDERLQLRWLVAASGAVAVVLPFAVLPANVSYLFEVVVVCALCLVPLSIGVAVLKYRLYDIDFVISRALVFGALGGFITATYALIVVALPKLVLASGEEPGLALSIIATGLVAIAFEPLRARLQRIANRLVFGRRATPYEVLTELTAGFAVTEIGSEGPQRLARLLALGTGAARAAVWLRVGDELVPLAQAPSDGPSAERVPVVGDVLPPLGTQVTVAVMDGERLIGALGIAKGRGDAVTSADERLIGDVAGSAGLLLRNLQLQAELRAHADQLQESRARLLATQDAARRGLERDLHDGAQQHLVALRLKLGLAATLARQEGATAVENGLKELSNTTQETVDAVRSIARGIYPPLLEAEGLAAAVIGAARLAAVPVAVEVTGLVRYPRVVESTVYFCVVEAINNAAAYAAPTSVVVKISATDGALMFSVRDDGCGFDPTAPTTGTGLANLADRLDILDGTLLVESRLGAGTTITGRLPAPSSPELSTSQPSALVQTGAPA